MALESLREGNGKHGRRVQATGKQHDGPRFSVGGW